jgi:hypothetical protein
MVQALRSLMPASSRYRSGLGFASATMSIQSGVGTTEEEQIAVGGGDAVVTIRSGKP